MTDIPIKRRKKLIETGIPLEAINEAAIREGFIYRGNPSALHKWWAQRPLAVARAVIFCQLVDDPGDVPEKYETENAVEIGRLKLFRLISELVKWENLHDSDLLEEAYAHIKESWLRTCADNRDHPAGKSLFDPKEVPPFHDPFSGSGALPLEAQRLGLKSTSADLNPVAVLLSRATIDYSVRFRDIKSIAPNKALVGDNGPHYGLSNDIIYYGNRLYEEISKSLGSIYPNAYPSEADLLASPFLEKYKKNGIEPIGWIWARTVKSPNPAFSDVDVPLASTFMLCTKTGREIGVMPIIEEGGYQLRVHKPDNNEKQTLRKGTKAGRGANFRCVITGEAITPDYVKAFAKEKGFGFKLLGIAVDTDHGRTYLSPDVKAEKEALSQHTGWDPRIEINGSTQYLGVKPYGISRFDQLFMPRQLKTLEMATSLIQTISEEAYSDATTSWCCSGTRDDDRPLSSGGRGPKAYSEAIGIYLAMAVDKMAEYNCSLVPWNSKENRPKSLFVRHAIPIVWDFVEMNPLGSVGGSLLASVKVVAAAIKGCSRRGESGCTTQADAAESTLSAGKIVSTDPPYYNNVPYADLSDFFYVWLRKSLKSISPVDFATIASPKKEELVAFSYRHNEDRKLAEKYFLDGMQKAMKQVRSLAHPAYPTTIYYAFKQAETDQKGTISTGWESFLDAVINSGFEITGTWPLRTERKGRSVGNGANALASSIVLVCQKRNTSKPTLSRSNFRRDLRNQLPKTIRELEQANIAPVDVAQAAIGPGIAIFSQAKAVLKPDDSPMSVREALIEINEALDEHLSRGEASFDADTRFALTFYESYGYDKRPYGDAEGLAVARNVSVQGVTQAGILSAIGGKAQLLRREQLDADWDPSIDDRLCVWEATQHLIKKLYVGGEASAAALLTQLKTLPGQGELAANCRALAYRLYNHCEKTKQTEEARAYNGLVIAWPELERLASSQASESAVQTSLI